MIMQFCPYNNYVTYKSRVKQIILSVHFPFKCRTLVSHFRMAFIPMCYLYGKKFVGPITKLVVSLREELHMHPYEKIDWKQARKLCAKISVSTTNI
jgi:hypothetical protein